jgi:hypothetical protein
MLHKSGRRLLLTNQNISFPPLLRATPFLFCAAEKEGQQKLPGNIPLY